jgi:hypothetical protein
MAGHGRHQLSSECNNRSCPYVITLTLRIYLISFFLFSMLRFVQQTHILTIVKKIRC